MSLRKIPFTLGLVLILLLSACAAQNGGAAADISGEWTLASLNGQEPVAGTTVTAIFENGEVGGRACNSYGGQYSINGQSLSISNLFNTEMACVEPAGIMEQESAYLQTLSQAASFSVTGEQLEIQNAAGDTVLTFSRGQ